MSSLDEKKYRIAADSLIDSLDNAYDGKSALVIGGAGFVGHALVIELMRAGANVFVFDNFCRGEFVVDGAEYFMHDHDRGSFWVTALQQTRFGFLNASADDPEAVAAAYNMAAPDFVFNLAAAVAGVLHNQKNHLQMYVDNVALLSGPLRAFDYTDFRPDSFLQTSSVCIYAEEYQNPCSEVYGFCGVPHAANAGYAEAKRDGERMLLWAGLPHAVIARPSNIIGAMDYYDQLAHVVPAVTRRLAETDPNDKFVMYGPSHVQREFIFNHDVALGMMYAAARGGNGEAYNIGTNGETIVTMRTLAHKLADRVDSRLLAGSKVERDIVFKADVGGGDSVRHSDASKLRALGWRPVASLNYALDVSVNDYFDRVRDSND